MMTFLNAMLNAAWVSMLNRLTPDENEGEDELPHIPILKIEIPPLLHASSCCRHTLHSVGHLGFESVPSDARDTIRPPFRPPIVLASRSALSQVIPEPA